MKSVLIGMSGGVDSSVAAALLKEQGYHVIGATMRLWTYSDSVNSKHEGCCAESAVEDARRVCDKLGIDFYVMNFKDLFHEKVVDNFIEEYKRGRTPNPCIRCNKYLKFDAMLRKARAMDIDYIATGHYALIEQQNNKYVLRMSKAAKKDQSYVLYNFTQEQLSHTLMPLGGYNKDEVRALAEKYGLAVANKPDSQEICFVEDDDYARFITDYSGYQPQEGDILNISGEKIGTHKGLIYYTVGQRKGIGAYGRPMFIKEIDAERNTIILGEKGMEFSDSLVASDVNFISGEFPTEPIKIQAKARYQAPPADAMLYPLSDGNVKVVFDKPQRAITPGQAVVFYDGDLVLGGGTIK